jgi:hypothetical protein
MGWNADAWQCLDFSHSANDIRLDGTILTAELPMRDGGYRERQGVNLDDRISNQNGRLVVSLPCLSAPLRSPYAASARS